jgi:phosphatidylinositol dimannoside acyltransferase
VPDTGRTREKVTDMTQRVADEFGAAITAHPEHWHMLQRLWESDRRGSASSARTPGTCLVASSSMCATSPRC